MSKDPHEKQKKPRTYYWFDALLVVVLLAVALGVRWLTVRAVVFPPLDDPAFYLTTAENLVSGRILEVDALWSYQVPFSSVTHPSHEHWMPLSTGLIAGVLALLRALPSVPEALASTLRAGQVPGLILGALLVPLTYIFGRRTLPGAHASARSLTKGNRWVALGAALLVAANATLSYQSASADSSAPYALFAAWALAVAVRKPGDEGSYFGTGLLLGLCYLARADGLLLVVAIPLAWWLLPIPARPLVDLPDKPAARLAWEHWPREAGSEEEWRQALGPSLMNVLDLIVGFALLVGPWLMRNYLAFGTPLPTSVLSQAWLTDYVDTFNFQNLPTWETLLAQGWPAILAQRGQALLHNGSVFLKGTFPWGLLALPGFWLLRREWPYSPPMVYGLLLFFVTAILFPVASVSGTFYHSLGAIVPFLALAAVYAAQRGIERLSTNPKLVEITFGAVTAALVVLAGWQVAVALPATKERHQAEKEQFEAAAAWLAQHASAGDVVMTPQPYTLNYASGHPCIVLPGNEAPEVVWEAAQQYGARFLIITQSFGQYPEILHKEPDPRFRLLEASDVTEIYEIVEGEP
jgi:hypothetical protein